ncbi:formin-binding protein HOF1 CYBJADRAFT_121738, partial [Cyberlindnera jadinii NRRL Y-1542]
GRDERGSEVVINRLHQGAQSCEELMRFYKERIALEEEYSRRLEAISRRSIGTYETGNLREAFETLRGETEQMAKSHSNQAKKLQNDSLKTLSSFSSTFVANRQPVEHSVEKIRKSKQAMNSTVLRLKERYQAETTKLNTLIAQESLLLGREQDKNRQKIHLQQELVSEVRQEYQISVKKLQELQATWIDEWRLSSAKLQEMEVSRIDFLLANIWEYTNSVSSSCVNDDAACETVRKSLEQCNAQQEIDLFVQKFGTGREIYTTEPFVDYLNGESDGQFRPRVVNTLSSETRSSSDKTLLQPQTAPPLISKKDTDVIMAPSNEDPLRATLEDLKHGGNGDMHRLKEMLNDTDPSQRRSRMSEVPDFRSSGSSQTTTGTTRILTRPKSMIEDLEQYQQQEAQKRNAKRSSFHSGIRSQSRSSINIPAKLSNNGLPMVTRNGKRVLKHAKALFDFSATIDGELTFKEGDVLSVLHMQEDGWWECERIANGAVGLAPYNYLETI